LKGKAGKLYIGQKEAIKIAKERGTPIFLYSKTQILSNFYNLLELFQINTPLEIRICYAMKAKITIAGNLCETGNLFGKEIII